MRVCEKEMEVSCSGHEMAIRTGGPRQTARLGKELGRHCCPGDIICLSGELGSGKTIFTKGIAQGLEIPKSYEIVSPSFTLINQFPGKIPLYHMDFYRFQGPDEAEEIGVVEYLYGDGVSVIEWPERIMTLLSENYLQCQFQIQTKRTREITFSPEGKRARVLFDDLFRTIKNSQFEF